MITFNDFSIEWKSEGTDLLEHTQFINCTVDFFHRAIPRIQVTVKTLTPEYIVTAVDTELTLVLKDNSTLDFKFFVHRIKGHSGGVFDVIGFNCTSDMFKLSNNAYLGDSLDTALSKVCDFYEINFSTSVSGDFFQINETNLQCLLRLLRGCSDSQTFEFTNNSIELIDSSETFELPQGERLNLNVNFVTDDNSEPIVDTKEDYFSQGWNKGVFWESSSEAFTTNLLSTLKYEKGFDVVIASRYVGVPVGFVGAKAKTSFSDLTYEEFTIIGKIVHFPSNAEVHTELVLGVQK